MMLRVFSFYCERAVYHMERMQYWDKQCTEDQTKQHYNKAIVSARACGYHRAKYKQMLVLADEAL